MNKKTRAVEKVLTTQNVNIQKMIQTSKKFTKKRNSSKVVKTVLSEFSVSKIFLYLMNCQFYFEISIIHNKIIQCINDFNNDDVNLNFCNLNDKQRN